MRFLVFLGLVSCFLFSSCRTQRAIYNYLEDMGDTALKTEVRIVEPAIQKNDQLHIRIYSASLDPEIDELYNLQQQRSAGGGGGGGGQNSQMQGFLVDQHGNVELPRIGVIHAEGLTKSELADTIKSRLQGQLINPSVVIRYLNFRVSIIGEVFSPGVQTVPVENLTLLQAIAMAGDITEFGKKKEVKILREYNGKRELGVVDMTSSNMFNSPYYHLKQNDVVLVDQTRYKLRRTEQQRITQQIGFALSIITSITLLYNIFNN